MDTADKTLAQMIAEVVEVNTANGWYEKNVSFGEAMALMHSEVSEALEAWRKNGLESWYVRTLIPADGCRYCMEIRGTDGPECPDHLDKPEGVPSEFADIFIRLLDYAYRFGELHLDMRLQEAYGFALDESFPENMDTLHNLIARTSIVWQEANDPEFPEVTWQSYLVRVLVFLRQLCELYGIDLAAEYERKLSYNRTRGYRHGNKPI